MPIFEGAGVAQRTSKREAVLQEDPVTITVIQKKFTPSATGSSSYNRSLPLCKLALLSSPKLIDMTWTTRSPLSSATLCCTLQSWAWCSRTLLHGHLLHVVLPPGYLVRTPPVSPPGNILWLSQTRTLISSPGHVVWSLLEEEQLGVRERCNESRSRGFHSPLQGLDKVTGHFNLTTTIVVEPQSSSAPNCQRQLQSPCQWVPKTSK